VKSVVEHRESQGLFRWKTSMRYTLSNALPKPVTVGLIQDGLWGDTTIVSESQKSQRLAADSAQWDVIVPANGKTDVTATFDSKY
jgi:hypothetical protein